MIIEAQPADAAALEQAVQVLRQGGLVAFPTETVYGLGADASNPEAVRRIFIAKGRPADHPLIVHIGSIAQITDWASWLPAAARTLAEHFWPGPLAMILQKRQQVPLAVTGGQQTVGLRMPDNPIALDLLNAFNGGIAAPSANRFNRISPTRAEHVVEELDGKVDMILDGGSCRVGVESTIVDLSGARPVLLRPGYITRAQLEAVLQTTLDAPRKIQTRAPGLLELHYAPLTPSLLCSARQLHSQIQQLIGRNKRIGVMLHHQQQTANPKIHLIQMPQEAQQYARVLYAALRELDSLQLDVILVEKPPETENWRAINDRLGKATMSV